MKECHIFGMEGVISFDNEVFCYAIYIYIYISRVFHKKHSSLWRAIIHYFIGCSNFFLKKSSSCTRSISTLRMLFGLFFPYGPYNHSRIPPEIPPEHITLSGIIHLFPSCYKFYTIIGLPLESLVWMHQFLLSA